MEKVLDLKKVILIDTPSLIYRAFYALPEMSTRNGFPTNAVYGFSLMLLRLLKEEIPDYICCAFDTPSPTFRHKKYTEYKIQRQPTPQKLIQQIPLIKDLLDAFGIVSYEADGYEADDIIATLVHKIDGNYLRLIFSGDLDLLQLVDENIFLVSTKKGITETITYTPQKVFEKYEIMPSQLVDLKALSGDASDNIQGVKGIGEKTAISLLKKFDSVENIIKNLDKIEQEHLRESISLCAEQILSNKDIIKLHKDVPLDISLQDMKVKLDIEKIKHLFEKLQFKTLLKKIDDIVPQEEQLSLL